MSKQQQPSTPVSAPVAPEEALALVDESGTTVEEAAAAPQATPTEDPAALAEGDAKVVVPASAALPRVWKAMNAKSVTWRGQSISVKPGKLFSELVYDDSMLQHLRTAGVELEQVQ